MKANIFLCCLFLFAHVSFATIIQIPVDMPSIQAGIDVASIGDTILVQPGTFIENINFAGKNLVVGSLFLTTRDTSFISATIIDGDSSGSTVIFENGEDSTAVLTGFTLRNGAAQNGGGIYCFDSTPSLEYLTIKENTAYSSGGGICYIRGWQSQFASEMTRITGLTMAPSSFHALHPAISEVPDAKLSHVKIIGNKSDFGGGVYFGGAVTPDMKSVRISENSATFGGGICCFGAGPLMSNVTIRMNRADICGGMYCSSTAPTFDQHNRCNIHSNRARMANDLLTEPYNDIIPVVLDTFTVQNPTDYYALPASHFSFDILHNIVEQSSGDLYVNPQSGDESNSGSSIADPLRTISHAFSIIFADSLREATLHLAESTYSPSSGESFPLVLPSYVTLSGASADNVVLDAEGLSPVLALYWASGPCIKNLTVTGGLDGGITCHGSSPRLLNLKVINNTSNHDGGGIYCDDSVLEADSLTISKNTASANGGGIYCRNSTIEITKCTLEKNQALVSHGGAIYYYSDSQPLNPADTVYVNIYQSHFFDNMSGGGGAGMAIRKADFAASNIKVHIDECQIARNSSSYYSGLQISGNLISFSVENSIFSNNIATTYAAAAGFSVDATGMVSNCLFNSNTAATGGENWNSGGASVWSGANVDIMNCTFVQNTAAYGAGLTVGGGGRATATNCIFWRNSPDQIALDSLYHLSAESPCIGMGIDSLVWDGLVYYAPSTDLYGQVRPHPAHSKPDIGAIESAYQHPADVHSEQAAAHLPLAFALCQNNPNPFNPITTITYNLPRAVHVKLTIYNVLGRHVRRLVDTQKPAGQHRVTWDATNDSGQPIAAGLYFCRMDAEEFMGVIQLLLVK
ncbi:DUF1565 domain-containing protein [candidate division KSB1 bacterium]|nr:DUF1565 domain-containing protein [candidate division KSB1 bacterium]